MFRKEHDNTTLQQLYYNCYYNTTVYVVQDVNMLFVSLCMQNWENMSSRSWRDGGMDDITKVYKRFNAASRFVGIIKKSWRIYIDGVATTLLSCDCGGTGQLNVFNPLDTGMLYTAHIIPL